MRRLTSKDLMPEELLDERPRISVTVSVWQRTRKGFSETMSVEKSWRESKEDLDDALAKQLRAIGL
jgi:hypothetical protein